MQHNPLITLTTDFGYQDPFVGIMKGVILAINPSVNIVDITHGISPQNIAEASITIGMSFQYFPHKTAHVVIVDPGVGSVRRPILVTTDPYFLTALRATWSFASFPSRKHTESHREGTARQMAS